MKKETLINLDKSLLGGFLYFMFSAVRQQLRYRERKQVLNDFQQTLGFTNTVYYSKNKSCLLSKLCDQYGSDKGEIVSSGHPYPWPSHTYADFYAMLFDHCRFEMKHVFECGLGTNNPEVLSTMGVHGKPGASLRVWRDYFPNAQVVGADIDRGVLFQEDRIRTFFVDQTNPDAIAELWSQAGQTFDLIIDDGLHTFEAGLCLFKHSIDRLAPNGTYIIEDVRFDDLQKFKNYFSRENYNVRYGVLTRPDSKALDNNLITIRRK
jgi:hypothetical protein